MEMDWNFIFCTIALITVVARMTYVVNKIDESNKKL